jgi:uncharacterized membrane protein YgcG
MCAQEWLPAAVAAAARPLTNPAALLFPGDRLLLDGRQLDWQRRHGGGDGGGDGGGGGDAGGGGVDQRCCCLYALWKPRGEPAVSILESAHID